MPGPGSGDEYLYARAAVTGADRGTSPPAVSTTLPTMLVFEITTGEMIESIEAQAKSSGISDAAIVSLIGGVDAFAVSTMPAHDARQDILSAYQVPGEMHGSGEIRAGKAHVHATFAIQGDRAVAGHVHSAEIGTWFARAYVIPVGD